MSTSPTVWHDPYGALKSVSFRAVVRWCGGAVGLRARRALARGNMQSEPWAFEGVAKVHLILSKASRGARICAHKPIFINGL